MRVLGLPARAGRARCRRWGFSLVEALLAMVLLAVAISGVAGSMISAHALNRVNRETALAQRAAERAMEEMQGVPFAEVFAAYNATAADDGTLSIAPRGPAFAVAGLDPQLGDPDGQCGRIGFPTLVVGGIEELREDIVDPGLGMPRDLNASGGPPDGLDHSTDYELLPVRVVVEWRGVSGNREYAIETMLADR